MAWIPSVAPLIASGIQAMLEQITEMSGPRFYAFLYRILKKLGRFGVPNPVE